MERIVLHVEAQVNPTESDEKVKKAMTNLFGQVTIQSIRKGNDLFLEAEATGQEALERFRNLLAFEHIRDAARRALQEGITRGAVTFHLNKQVAYAGHVSFSMEKAESPLGPITVTIKCSDPHAIINWLAPKSVAQA
jgi:predicted RNA binding protein with dsRBD fold (UPF0201 family)